MDNGEDCIARIAVAASPRDGVRIERIRKPVIGPLEDLGELLFLG